MPSFFSHVRYQDQRRDWRRPPRRERPPIAARRDGAQEAQAIARRKVIYEEIHPETKTGVAGATARWNANPNLGSASPAFVDDAANKTGKSRTDISRAAARGKVLGNDLNDIAGKVTQGETSTRGFWCATICRREAKEVADIATALTLWGP